MPTQVHASRVWALWEKAGFVLGIKMWLLPVVGARNEGADADAYEKQGEVTVHASAVGGCISSAL